MIDTIDSLEARRRAERREFVEAHRRQRDTIHRIAERRDKFIISGAAGAIFLSVTFLDRIAQAPFGWTAWLLYLAWLCFLIGLAVSLRSLFTSEESHRQMLRDFEKREMASDSEERHDADSEYGADTQTRLFNEIAYWSLVAGSALLTLFAGLNLPDEGDTIAAGGRPGIEAAADPGASGAAQQGQSDPKAGGGRDG